MPIVSRAVRAALRTTEMKSFLLHGGRGGGMGSDRSSAVGSIRRRKGQKGEEGRGEGRRGEEQYIQKWKRKGNWQERGEEEGA